MPTIPPRLSSPSPADLPEVLQFMQLLWAVVHGLERTSKRMNADHGVTGPQRLVLRVVGLFPGMSAGDLASTLHLHPSTLTGVLQRLVAQRLLRRVADITDRRRAVLVLTTKGERVNALAGGTVEAAVADVLADLTSRDQAATKRTLARLARRLDPDPATTSSQQTTAHMEHERDVRRGRRRMHGL